ASSPFSRCLAERAEATLASSIHDAAPSADGPRQWPLQAPEAYSKSHPPPPCPTASPPRSSDVVVVLKPTKNLPRHPSSFSVPYRQKSCIFPGAPSPNPKG
ncbi:unnamed protein product, partial [Scytosiphon promiscuus]